MNFQIEAIKRLDLTQYEYLMQMMGKTLDFVLKFTSYYDENILRLEQILDVHFFAEFAAAAVSPDILRVTAI